MMAPAASPPITPAATLPPRASAGVGAVIAAIEIAVTAARAVKFFTMTVTSIRGSTEPPHITTLWGKTEFLVFTHHNRVSLQCRMPNPLDGGTPSAEELERGPEV